LRLYPDSKTYFTFEGAFGQLFFDEDNKVSKFAISRGSFREEFQKID